MAQRTAASAADPLDSLDSIVEAALSGLQPMIDAELEERQTLLDERSKRSNQKAALLALVAKLEERTDQIDTRLAEIKIGSDIAPSTDVKKEPGKDEAEKPSKKTVEKDEAEKPDANTTDSEPDEEKPDKVTDKDTKKDETSNETKKKAVKKTEQEPKGSGKVSAFFEKYTGFIVGLLIAIVIIVLLWSFVSWLATTAVAGLMGLFFVLGLLISIILLILGPFIGSRRQHAMAKPKPEDNNLEGTED